MKRVGRQLDNVDDRYLRRLLHGMESLDQGFSVFDQELQLVYCNGRYLELLGLPHRYGETGTHLRKIYQFNAERGEYGPGDRAEQVDMRMNRAARFEAHCFVHERPNGQLIEVRGSPLAGGGFVSTYTDVTANLMAQRAAEASEQNLAGVVRGCAIPMFVLDNSHCVIHWNRACELATGISAESIIGTREAWRAFYPDPRPVLADLVLSQVPEQEIFHYYGAKKCQRSRVIEDGYEAEDFFPEMGRSGYWFYFTASPVRAPDGSVIGAVETLQDVTERNKVRAELETHQEQLEEQVASRTVELRRANEELSEYAYVVSHDLKAPLRAIRNYADFLSEDLDGKLEEEQLCYLEGLRTALKQGEQVVDDLLKYSRISREEGDREWFAPCLLVEDLKTVMQVDEDMEVVTDNTLPRLYGDRMLMTQTLQNLIANGLKFNRAKRKRVEIGWLENGGQGIEITIRDNGIGIPERYRDQVFGVFKRLHSTNEFPGTGIGLAIVKKAVQRMGWGIRVESIQNEGSCFYIQVPTQHCRLGNSK